MSARIPFPSAARLLKFTTDGTVALKPSLSANPAAEGRNLLTALGKDSESCAMIMDRSYEGDEMRELVSELDFSPVVPPKSSRAEPWEYNKELYKKRNQLFRQAD